MYSLVAAVILIVGFSALFLTGLPAAYWLCNSIQTKASNNRVWALAPFFGFVLLTTVLKTVTRLGIAVKYSAFPLAAVIILLFLLFMIKLKRTGRGFPLPGRQMIVMLIAVALLFSIGYLLTGAKYYHAYGWWDTIYYGQRAELLKNVSAYDVESLAEQTPYMAYFNLNHMAGLHRASTGVLQAFLSAVCFCDGACTFGFLVVLGPVLVFCALVYLTDAFDMPSQLMRWSVFFGSLLPAIALTNMECFLGAGSAMPLFLISLRLFPEMFGSKKYGWFLLVGLFASCMHTTLADGDVVILAVLILSFIYHIFSERISWKKLLICMLVFACAYVLPNLLFAFGRTQFLSAVAGGSSVLTTIYPFANSVNLLPWVWFGVDISNAPGLLWTMVRFLSVILFALGAAGLTNRFMMERSSLNLNVLLLLLLPFTLICLPGDNSYSFCKMFAVLAPLLVVGIACFVIRLQKMTDEGFMNASLNPSAWKKKLKSLLTACFYGVFAVSTSCSAYFVAASIPEVDAVLPFSDRRFYLQDNRDDTAIALYDKLSSTKDKNYVIICESGRTRTWWTYYFGRENNLYLLLKESDDTYDGGYDYSYTDLSRIPADAEIITDIVDDCNLVDNAPDTFFATPIGYCGEQSYCLHGINTGEARTLERLHIRGFSNNAFTGILKIQTGVETEKIVCDGTVYEAQNGEFLIPISGQPGAFEIVITADEPFVFLSSSMALGES